MEKGNYLITTRPAEKNRQTVSAACFYVRNIPLTRIVENLDTNKFRHNIEEYLPDFVVITSSIGSQIFLKAGVTGNYTVMCIGKKTAEPFLGSRYRVLDAKEQNSTGLVNLVSAHATKTSRIALCRSRQHNEVLDNYLASNGFDYRCFDLYDIVDVHPPELKTAIIDQECRGIVLTSSMEARSLSMELGSKLNSFEMRKKKIFCIGKPTYEAARRLGLNCEATESESDVDAIIEEISKKHCNSGEWI
ncbi:MAG: uroporphyrinogen-III synthase [Candidatus Thermoplasmatota archaeon]|nr:uroporphyrinogen-III synthase [Candidatus Thermoplasmatota archaeon]